MVEAMAWPPSLSTRLRWRRRLRSFGALLLLAAMAAALWLSQPVPAEAVPLVQVIDGDSLSVRHEGAVRTIRLGGLDAVEYRQRCTRADGGSWACGQEARTALVGLAGRGPLFCTFAAKDKYGRTLAACRTRPEPGGVDLAGEMIQLGWAVATDDALLPEEGAAERARRGIWAGEFERPADWRAAHARPAAILADH
jgi:endonuclease YncB( thermonuclease family)